MKIVVFGTGGVGGFFGGKLSKSGSDVWFVARGEHLAAMKSRGLQIHSTEGSWLVPPGKMTDDPAEVGAADVVLFCVKSYDTESAARRLAPMLTPRTLIISLQNGIDNEEKIGSIVPTGQVYGGVANIYSTISAPGVITESGGPRKFIFGPLKNGSTGAESHARTLLEESHAAGIHIELSPDILLALWKKFIFITAVGGLTALTRLTLGEILRVPETRELLDGAMRETLAVSPTQGVVVESGYIPSVFEALATFHTETRSSLHYDLSHERPLEIEALSGMVARIGLREGIPTPIHRTIYAALLPYHLRNSHARTRTGGRP